MSLWYQALRSFWQEWEEDSFWEHWEEDENDGRRAFFEMEKVLFDEAKKALASRPRDEENSLRMKKYNTLKNASAVFKGKWFAQAKGAFEEAKLFMEKVKMRPGGVWFRPKCDTVSLRWYEMVPLTGCRGLKMENVRSLAVEEFWYGGRGEEGRRIWEVLLYGFVFPLIFPMAS